MLIMHPGPAVSQTDEIGVIVLDHKVVDFVTFGSSVPLDRSHNQRRTSSRDDGIADGQSTGRHKALTSHIERMFASRHNCVDDLVPEASLIRPLPPDFRYPQHFSDF